MDRWTDLPPKIGRYEIVRPLGRGGGGRVVEAILHGPAGFRKSVALKVLHAAEQIEQRSVARLLREARLGGLLSHPNVVSTLELGQDNGIWFVSMELVRGSSLSTRLASGPLPAAAVIDVGLQVSAALAHIHELSDGGPLRLVHGDVKPSNLLLDHTGLIRLADFGLAGLQAELVGKQTGTLGFVAPEQADGRAEPRSDLFALGVTLLTLCTGTNPLGHGLVGLQAVFTIEARLADPAFLAPAEAHVPGLGEVIRRCLRSDPADRYPDARHLARDLQRLKGAGPSLAELASTARDSAVPPIELGTSPSPAPRADMLVGRQHDIRRILEALRSGHRLISLVGPAGVGKTRLALEVGKAILDRSVRVCELASANNATEVCVALARSLGGDLRAGDPVAQVGRMITGRPPTLLILDNVEQVVEDAAELIAGWMSETVQFIVTSRAPLHLAEEHLLAVDPLDLEDAIELFGARRHKVVEAEERDTVIAILDGADRLPLAIELLAARGRRLSVQTLQERLRDRFQLLVGAPRDADPRHRSLLAAIQWSWDLLTPWARSALAQLSVFAGPFSLMSAEAVLEVSDSAPWVLDILETLADNSLVRVRGDRFELLQSVRDFAAKQLSPDDAQRVEIRHGALLAVLGSEAARRALSRSGGGERLSELTRAFPDLVAATRAAVARGDVAVAGATALAALEVTALRGPVEVGLELISAVLELPTPPLLQAQLQERAGDLHGLAGNVPAGLVALEAALACFQDLGELGAIARTRARIGQLYRQRGHLAEAKVQLERALVEARASGAPEPQIRALNELGLVHQIAHRPDLAVPLLEAALAVAVAAGHQRGQGVALANLGLAQWSRNELERAQRSYHRAEEALHALGDRRAVAMIVGHQGLLAFNHGDRRRAIHLLRQAAEMHSKHGARRMYAIILGNLGLVMRHQGQPEEAVRYLEGSLQIHREMADDRAIAPALSTLALSYADLGDPTTARRLLEEALALNISSANTRSEALVLCQLAELDLEEDDLEAAEQRLDRASEAVDGPWPAILAAIAESRGRLRQRQGDLAEAQRQLTLSEAHLAPTREPYAWAALHVAQGSLAVALGDRSRALDRLRRAEALMGDEQWPAPLTVAVTALRRRISGIGPAASAELHRPTSSR